MKDADGNYGVTDHSKLLPEEGHQNVHRATTSYGAPVDDGCHSPCAQGNLTVA